ncbi:MAG TPA: hypothetical protein VIL20_12000 [Sandaracinaceae bacterium]
MAEIDWGDLTPTHAQRARARAWLAELAGLEGPVVALRRRGSGYEAHLLTLPPAEVRLAGEDLVSVIDRACHFLSFVAARDRRRAS